MFCYLRRLSPAGRRRRSLSLLHLSLSLTTTTTNNNTNNNTNSNSNYNSNSNFKCKMASSASSTSSQGSSSFVVPAATRAVMVGSGSDGMNEPEVCAEILRMTGKTEGVRVLYLGTATYDLDTPQQRQTQRFTESSAVANISALKVADSREGHLPDKATIDAAFEDIDVVVVSGGNTLFAMEAWTSLGIDTHLRRAMERGVVLSGGSAGLISFFDAGHSDSDDPDSYRAAMLADQTRTDDDHGDASEAKPWKYVRVPCLGFFPGLCCPHYDKTQSNGVPRSEDFDAMLLRHPGERGIGIDHFAALCVEGNRYKVLSIAGKAGSVLTETKEDGTSSTTFSLERKGVPGMWIAEVEDGQVVKRLGAMEGALDVLLRTPTAVVEDPAIPAAKARNPWKQ